jgi:predicted hotdog family 3-hydroxylacyl-ACP dehydratase
LTAAAPDIASLIPHAGAMCVLESVTHWSADAIECRAVSHLDPANPLRRDGRLGIMCGIEYALQAAAVHGALRGGAPQPPGYLASLRMSTIAAARLDDPALGALAAHARREHGDATGLLYAIRLNAADGRVLLEGRATIILTKP